MVQFIKKVTSDIYIVSFELFKIMIPTLILVKIAEIYGLVAVLTNLFAPIMTMMGLPAEMALAITTTMLTNPYAGIIVLASTPGIEDLTVAQTTILASSFYLHIQLLLRPQFHAKPVFQLGLLLL